ncbi:class I SAM-dependent methyltransferase [Anaerococcus sp.]|uniref:class I SAM-dependent DNA methyltransferase n=1 Tax=Anaerococcus sp. TaxID=1872515 RepID=UPI0027B91DDA|nr:class I SAM-dependent methyltransferase [Anaerococcus sp.]
MYDDFSYIYDKLSFDLDYEKYAENIKSRLKKYGIKKENMLELAAGSGMLTKHFFDEFENIDALDISGKMLEVFANKYDPDNVNLIHYDMVEYVKEDAYDLIVILLDSVNYVTEKEDLLKLFRNCYASLKKGGLLVFDINSPYKIREVFGNECYVYEYEDIFYTWDNFYEDELCDMHLEFFVENEDGSYRRISEFQQERLYEIEEVKEIIEDIGFKNIEIFDEDDMGSVKEESLRILFSQTKE